jgi:23S rRNA (cytosine1962-C5)-methyltransferase
MFAADQYQLLDFGSGRKLERFGEFVLDRPSPAAETLIREHDPLWSMASARFVAADDIQAGCGQRGRWMSPEMLRPSWTIGYAPLVLELRPTEFGHVGVFPEQAENWDWIARQVARLQQTVEGRPRVLNLFAYTGASTLAAAAAGAEVVHIDAAASTVAWARRNAKLSSLSGAPVRWIAEDAARFAAREVKRGSRFHGIILDPPSYGHGPKGEQWQIERDLPTLLNACASLLDKERGFLLLTCHSLGIGSLDLGKQLRAALPAAEAEHIVAGDLWLTTSEGHRLHSGVAARWSSD